MHLLLYIIWLFGPLSEGRSNQELVIELSSDQETQLINPQLQAYHTLDTLEGPEAWSRIITGTMPIHSNSSKGDMDMLNHGFWLPIPLKNIDASDQTYYLELAFNRSDRIKLFEVLGDGRVLQRYETGDLLPFRERPLFHRNFIFPLSIEAGESRLYLLGYEKRGSVSRFPLKVYSSERFTLKRGAESILFGSFFGVIILISFGSLLFGFLLKRKTLLAYGAYAIAIFMYLFTSLGLTFQYFTSDFPQWNRHNLIVLGPITIISLTLFVQRYFHTGLQQKRNHKLLNVWIALNGLHIVLITLFNDFFEQFGKPLQLFNYLVILLSLLSFFLVSWQARTHHLLRARYFVIGLACSFAGIFYAVAVDLGMLEEPLMTDNTLSILIGFILEFGFLTVALVKTVYPTPQTIGKSNFPESDSNPPTEHVFLNNERILVESILYIESYGHYLKYHLSDENQLIIVRQTMNDAMSKLDEDKFHRIHRSFIVNLDHIKKPNSKEVVMNNDQVISISKSYRDTFRATYSAFLGEN